MKQLKINLSLLFIFASLLFVAQINPVFGYVSEINNQTIDIKSKAQELGISENQLTEILSSSIKENDPDDSLQTDAISSSRLTGAAPGDWFGYSVSGAGDVNGDGFDDVIVGAYFNDAAGTEAGRAYIYFGGIGADNSPDLIFTGETAGDWFGYSVSGAGDVNGDGFDDVVVGAYSNDAGGFNAGRAYIYFGGNSMNNIADVVITGAAADDFLGYSVSGAGDVNGDGFHDIIAGAYSNDAGGTNAGRAYIYFGGNTMNNIADIILTGEATGDSFGISVSDAGDINGDGFNDVIVGAHLNDASGLDAGRAYVYLGGSSMNNISDVVFTGEAPNDRFGSSVSGAGDLNGDGFSDITTGAPRNDAAGADAGRAYIYFGDANMNNISDVIFTGEASTDLFGISVSDAGDVNGDGFNDVIIGAYGNNAGGIDAGRAYIYLGGISMNNTVDIIFTGESGGDNFGNSVSCAGDVNGDSFSDVIVGANFNDAAGNAAGAAYIYKNSLIGPDIPDERMTGVGGDFFGGSVSDAGDVNGDGFGDIIVGALGSDVGGADIGRAYIYFGGAVINNVVDVTLTGETAGNHFGGSVSGTGDVNGDGFSDVIVGARDNSAGGTNAGRAYIYFGGSSMNNVADVILTGAAADDFFGYSVSGAGDVNDDGYSDVIVGAYSNDAGGTNAGRAYIYFGGSSMNNSVDVTLTGEAAFDFFGVSVSDAGDVNGDSFNDVIVGAYFNDAAASGAGRAYIYFGGSSMNNTADVILTGIAADDNFGMSVSTANDINRDGYSDVIVGAPGTDGGAVNNGRAYIYYGGLSMNNSADVFLSGLLPDDFFGRSVSPAGDVNGDGFDDIIVGSYMNDGIGSNSGRAYTYFGGVSMDNTADVILTGQAADDYFGISVSSAGDMNGDGLADIIAGADQNDAGGSSAGAAYIYISSSPEIAPRIMSIKDVPNDQGGFVHAKFIRSGYDMPGINKITSYIIERSRPPGAGGFFWEQVASINPNNNLGYLFTGATWGDSTYNGSDRVYYRVTAKTSNSSEYWRSNIMYGGSIDNLSPSIPLNLLASSNPDYINLGWNRNTEPDLKDYLIYRNNANISVSNTNFFVDITANPDSLYIYEIAARDIHGNISPLSNPDTASLETITFYNVKIIPEGIYNAATDQLRMRDTVKAYLWDLTGSTLIDSAASVIDSVLFTANFDFKYAPSGTYYLAIVHRNCIETWSKVGGETITRGASYGYDFTASTSQAYGDNLKLKGTRYCLYSGDINSSGVVNSTDRTLIRNNVGYIGYSRFDLDGNGVVNSSDRTIVRNNTGIFRQRP